MRVCAGRGDVLCCGRSVMRLLVPIFLWLVCVSMALGAGSRAELLFELQTALKQKDREKLTECFNFDRLSEGSKAELVKIIDRMTRWPTHYVKTSERAGAGTGGVTLNGDWTFQVHIYADAESQKGFVFPAGTTGKGTLILAAVE